MSRAYFLLDIEMEEDTAVVHESPDLHWSISWFSGSRIAEPIPNPLSFTLDTDYGVTEESDGDIVATTLVSYYPAGIPLMSKELVDTLLEAGVSNLELFPAVLTIASNGIKRNDYYAVNVVGLVAAADLSRSVFRSNGGRPLIDTAFDSLVLDPSKTNDQKLFRLAESVTGLFVSEDVRTALEKKRLPGLVLRPAETFFSL